MERSFLFYMKAVIAILFSIVVLMFLFLNVYDYSNADIVEAQFIDGKIYHEDSNNSIATDSYQKMLFKNGDTVKVLYNESSNNIIYYGNFYEYFKPFFIGSLMIFFAWFLVFLGESKNNKKNQTL